MDIKLYEIDENTARRAKEMMSWSDYKQGYQTSQYTTILTQFKAAVEQLINHYKPTEEKLEAVSYYCDRYSAKLAMLFNKEAEINCRCPSIMITGGSNFPVRKKEKQNAAYDKLMREMGDLYTPDDNYYYNKIEAMLSNKTIYSNDDLAVEKLTDKLNALQEQHELNKRMNAYYRKYGTMKGFEDMTDEEAASIDNEINTAYSWCKAPAPAWQIQNENAEIKRIKDRIEEITRLKENADKPVENKYPTVDGVKVEENAADMHIRLFFDGKPDEATRTLLKSNGFRWSPSNTAWQRQLTNSGIYAAQSVLGKLAEQQQGQGV